MQWDLAATYTVFLRTIRDAQIFHGKGDGSLPVFAPEIGQLNRKNKIADPGWATAYALLVEYVHEFYGDDRIWKDHYAHVARFIDFTVANVTDPETGLLTYSRFGDWCAFKWLPHTEENSGMGGCYGKSPLSSSFFFARQLEVLQRAAGRLGLVQDAAKWGELLSNVTRAFRGAFMQPDGSFSDAGNGGTQAVMGSQALVLAFPQPNVDASDNSGGWLTADERRVVGKALASNIAAHGYNPYAGELSVTYLFDALQQAGRPDIAVAMASNPSQPGWGFMVESGSTSMYESWYTDRYSSIGTRFHDMFAGPFVWFYRGLAGLTMKAGTAGWKELRIAPQAYNFWSQSLGNVHILGATWGGNCENRSSVREVTALMTAACVGVSRCTFRIPNDTDCHDDLSPRRKVFNVSYSCGNQSGLHVLTLGPDTGVHAGDYAGMSFTEAGGRVMHVDCRAKAEALHFVNAEVMTYQGRLASSWRVFPRTVAPSANQKHLGGHSSSLCGSVNVNTGRPDVVIKTGRPDSSEPAVLNLSCTHGLISGVSFASYGEPTGTCGNLSLNPACHHLNSTAVVHELCVGKHVCTIEATQAQFGGKDPCPRSGLKLNTGPHRLAVALQGCDSAPVFELNVTIPVGSRADIVLPAKLLGVDTSAQSTRVRDGMGRTVKMTADDSTGDLAVRGVGSGSYTFVLSAKLDDEHAHRRVLPNQQQQQQQQVKMYELYEVRLAGSSSAAAPFEVFCTALVTGPSGSKIAPATNPMNVTLFFDGTGEYAFRFTPDALGSWTWKTVCPHDDARLNGNTGVVQCLAGTQHGGLIQSAVAVHRLSHEDGTPFLPVALEMDWLWALNKTEQTTLAAHLSRFGFNYLLINLWANTTVNNKFPARTFPRVSPALSTPWASQDKLQLNLDFFHNWDFTLRTLAASGIHVHLMFYVGNKPDASIWPAQLSPADEVYWKHSLARFASFR